MTATALPAKEALHTAARRYCIDRAHLLEQRDRGAAAGNVRARFDLSARYDVLYAILTDIESLTPDDAASLEEMRDLLIVAGQTAWGFFMLRPPKATEVQAMDEERALFCDYVATLAPEDLRRVHPLPYRRTLSRREHERLWTQLQERWGAIRGYWYPITWYPLTGQALPTDVVAVQSAWFYHDVPRETLHGILREHGLTRIWELRVFGPECEMDVALLEPEHMAEAYWTSPAMDWLLYTSHDALTFAGDWLIAAIKRAWPRWDRHIWRQGDYERPTPEDG